MSQTSLSAETVDTLLLASTIDIGLQILQEFNLITEDGAVQLLASASEQIAYSPPNAIKLADLTSAVATQLSIPNIGIQARYLSAQGDAMMGRFPSALDKINQAIDQAEASQLQGQAWRMTLGKMRVLAGLGQLPAAIEAGTTTIAAIDVANLPDQADLKTRLHHNIGISHYQLGQYEQSLDAYQQAAEHEAILPAIERDNLTKDRALCLETLGNLSEAIAVFEDAITQWNEADLPLRQAKTWLNLGFLNYRAARYPDSLQALQKARDYFADSGTIDEWLTWLDSAEIYTALNLYSEALAAYNQAAIGITDDTLPIEQIRINLGIGRVHRLQGLISQSQTHLQLAQAQAEQLNHQPLLSQIHLELARLNLDASHLDDAENAAQTALGAISNSRAPFLSFQIRLLLADIELINGDLDAAEYHLSEARTAHTIFPHLDFALSQREGRLFLLRGNFEIAEATLLRTIDRIENLRSTLGDGIHKSAFLSDKLAPYNDLITLYLDQNEPESLQKALEIAERSRARTLVEMMRSSLDLKLVSQLDPLKKEKLAQLRSDLNGIYDNLVNQNNNERGRGQKLILKATQLEHEIKQIHMGAATQSIRSTTDTIHQTTFQITHLINNLPEDGVPVVIYHILNGEILAFIIQAGQVKLLRHLDTVSSLAPHINKLRIHWNRLRSMGGASRNHIQWLEKTLQATLLRLYSTLFKPLSHLLEQDGALPVRTVIIPHGILHQVPFHALFDGEQYLVERFEFSYAPSLTTYYINQAAYQFDRQIGLFGVFDQALPAISAEIDAIYNEFKHAERFVNRQATWNNFQTIAQSADWVHIASHAIYRPDNPQFSAFLLDDGWVTALEVEQLPRVPNLISLSACESGRNKVIPGDEILGLTQAFLAAGSQSILASQWIVQDDTTAMLMSSCLKNAKKNSLSKALRTAQLQIKQTFSHPYFWAPFMLYGQR